MRTGLLALSLIFSVSVANGDDVFSTKTFDDACAAAAKEKKIVLVDFYTTWCGPCKRLDATTWQDKDVQKWLTEKTISLKIDAEKQRELAKKYDVKAYPTILLLKPDGTEVDRLVGYKDAEEFLDEANSALAGKDAVARAKEKMKGGEEDPTKRMRYADTLAMKGRKQEALEEYLWCFDHGLESPGFYGVRLSFLLSSIHRLGGSYPPAIKALEERRDNAEKLLLAEPSSAGADVHQAAIDFSALNEQLNASARTLVVYDKLKSRPKCKEARRAMFGKLLDELIEAKRYKDVMEDVGDLDVALDHLFEPYNQAKAYFADKDKGQSPLDYMRKSAIEQCGKYYEAALGASQADDADDIIEKLLDFDNTKSTYRKLMRHALRARNREAAAELLKRAGKTLKPKQIESLRAILDEGSDE